jgi:DNA-binding SARP family transcriptional activator/Flp pilus assembly protein TadD
MGGASSVVTGMEFCLLGPLMVRSGDMVMPVPWGKLRVVLAALLLNADRVVSLDELAEVLWGPFPPPSARVSVQNYVMRLRKALGDTGGSRISTQPHGYAIHLDAGELDVTRFETHLGAARAAAQDDSWDTAATEARAAMSLWRGEPLADMDSDLLLVRDVPRLAELHLQALEIRIDADLHLGRHAEVISELRQLTRTHPLRERLYALLMLALYRDGRQGEALATYQYARRVLIDQLGVEPGTGLCEVHQRVLAADSALAAPEPALAVSGRVPPVIPRELPGTASNFCGRTNELALLTGLLEHGSNETPGTVVISAIGGTAGVGKTALAVHWAHQVADRFPDGQLYVNLRGYDPSHPMTAADALADFLRALGVAPQGIPPETGQRAALYRGLLAGRRMLVMLDNAGSAEQVRPLLPSTPACMTVVTSRSSLAGLVARDGAQRLDLDLLPLPEAVTLLRALIGGRIDADHAAAAALADQCCRLPLVLRVAAELAAARPTAPIAELVGELADQQRRLDLLDADGDSRTAVRAVFSWSYRRLGDDTARTFRLAGLHPGTDLDAHAAAALTGMTAEQAGGVLGQLARAHLIQSARPGRYGMHDLLRAYATGLVATQDEDEERHAALNRLFDYYLRTAAAAMEALYPGEHYRRPRVFQSVTTASPITGPVAARDWLDVERASLVAVAARMAQSGFPGHVTRLAATLYRYLHASGHFSEGVTIHIDACRAARRTGDHAAEAAALISLSTFEARQGSYQQATGHLQQSLAVCRETVDQSGEARARLNLGIVEISQGRYQQATGHLQQSLFLYRLTGDRFGEAEALNNLGFADERLQGRCQQAADHLEQALALFREAGNQHGEAHALENLGFLDLRQGHCQQAADHLEQALALFRKTGDPTGEAVALATLGIAALRQGHCQQATGHLRQAVALFRETDDRSGEAQALNGLGEVLLATGQPSEARTQHATALELAVRIGNKYEQARAHDGLGRSYHAISDASRGRSHWQEALTLYTVLDAPEADQVRAQLTTSGHGSGKSKP